MPWIIFWCSDYGSFGNQRCHTLLFHFKNQLKPSICFPLQHPSFVRTCATHCEEQWCEATGGADRRRSNQRGYRCRCTHASPMRCQWVCRARNSPLLTLQVDFPRQCVRVLLLYLFPFCMFLRCLHLLFSQLDTGVKHLNNQSESMRTDIRVHTTNMFSLLHRTDGVSTNTGYSKNVQIVDQRAAPTDRRKGSNRYGGRGRRRWGWGERGWNYNWCWWRLHSDVGWERVMS